MHTASTSPVHLIHLLGSARHQADAAAKAFNATFDVDDSLVNEDESDLPPELLSAPAVAD